MKYSRALDGESEDLTLVKPEIVDARDALVTIRPRVDVILDDAAAVLHAEILKIGERSKSTPQGLDEKGIRALNGLVDAVTKVSREERFRHEEEDKELGNMSEEELLSLALEDE